MTSDYSEFVKSLNLVDEEDEEIKEYVESSDAWFRGTMEAISIINELAQDKNVLDGAIDRITEATGHVGHVHHMLRALQVLNEKAADPDDFARILAEVRSGEKD